ncbi:hypothetical protein FEM48_Zijuj08G0172200 [Ziziphus jujuba var. spinosa]|uniref:Transcription factor CBF/NF-Y/archaeal histone domain-containing protein n=1 Tax=Ziziphus jujuba var. spinosa TaxID=714518 RepID=A0A978V0C6_ZIZJJ|nr:hypothetical protein FEM48_Zijuj08G0172200 [Ziziphus jujuba var. spinosa]
MTGKRNQTSPVGSPLSGNISDSSSKEHDRFLPIANVSRIMKKSLPANAKISKEAKETVQECVSEFISFITGEASDKCQREKRKTINGDDLLWAMTTLGFENYVSPLKVYLNKYREIEGEKNSMARQEDHHPHSSPTNSHATNENIVHHHHQNSKLGANSLSNRVDFQGLNGGFYSLGSQMTQKGGYEESGSRLVSYGDDFMNTASAAAAAAYNTLNGVHENGDAAGNANRAMAAQLHHGIGW